MATVRLGATASPVWKRGGWSDSPVTPAQLGLLVAVAASVVLRLVTFSPWVDGAWAPFLRETAFLVAAAAFGWGLVRLASSRRSVLPYVAALGMVVPADVVHVGRATHPISRSMEYVLADDFGGTAAGGAPEGTRWIPELQEGAGARVVDGKLEIVSPTGVQGFVGLRLGYELDPNRRLLWLPRGAFAPPAGEVLEWEAQVERQNRLAVILETRTVRIEATDFGLRVQYLLLDGKIDGADIEVPEVAAGAAVRYRLERTPQHPLQRLLVGDREIWALPKPPGTWEFARFGATRSDDEHGARLLVDDVRYRALFGGDAGAAQTSCPGGALFC
jgi:hypothetical protein